MQPKVIDHDTFMLDGEKVNRIVMDYNGHNVQVLGYGNSPILTVLVDNNAEQVNEIALEQYLELVCKGVKQS